MVGNNERERERDGFGCFLTRKRSVSLELLMIGNVSLSPTEILGSSYQGLVEREKMESWIGGVGMLWWCREKHREREREREREMNILILQ